MAEGKDQKMPDELQFLNYVSKLKHTPRAGWLRFNVSNPERIAGHMYRMGVMCGLIVDDPTLDLNKCIKMSLFHDIGESIIGDITPHDGVSNDTKHELETAAIDKLASLLPIPERRAELIKLFQEYEQNQTPEAKLVKDLDRFDMILQAYEYECSEEQPRFLQEFFNSTNDFFKNSHPKVKDLVTKLYAARDAGVPFSQ